jgi:exodeoxyribonuclease VII large subunit
MPQKVGVVSAIDGAALRDIVSVARRRFPAMELVIAPAKVQGSGAAASIVDAIELLNSKKDIDIIILARGGGSIEDLWAFNEEIVARSIYKSRIPIVTGVGHEVDFTIADFVSDLRAPTPSAAIEIITPDSEEIIAFINETSNELFKIVKTKLDDYKNIISSALTSYGFRTPGDIVRNKIQTLDNIVYKLLQQVDVKFLITRNKLNLLSNTIQMNDVQKTLRKGFVLVRQDDKFIRRAEDFVADKSALLKFYDSEITVKKN